MDNKLKEMERLLMETSEDKFAYSQYRIKKWLKIAFNPKIYPSHDNAQKLLEILTGLPVGEDSMYTAYPGKPKNSDCLMGTPEKFYPLSLLSEQEVDDWLSELL